MTLGEDLCVLSGKKNTLTLPAGRQGCCSALLNINESFNMTNSYRFQQIPKTRIATFDTFAVGLLKHHISALLEFDVTDARLKLRELRKNGINISFNAWLIKVISVVLQRHPETAAYLYNKKKLIIFDNINVSIIVEKKLGDSKVPIPLVINNANEKSALEISQEIEKAKDEEFSENNIVLEKESAAYERLYYFLPGFLRRLFWKTLLKFPKTAYKKMGNVVITSVGMIGKINGWFIQRSVHPISFGVGSILKKPVVIENEIKIREILNMTVLVDHDVVDGAPMVRFLNDLTYYIETGKEIKAGGWNNVSNTT
ncbi:MAG: 2-oxo acid dehydrogenase subunit E2 [Bacteroidales bacterium]